MGHYKIENKGAKSGPLNQLLLKATNPNHLKNQHSLNNTSQNKPYFQHSRDGYLNIRQIKHKSNKLNRYPTLDCE